jgi:hypothetical protein
LTHHAAPGYWDCYKALSESARLQVNRSFDLLKSDPGHPLLHLKQVDRHWTVRIDLHHRAVAVEAPEGLVWFWVGTHDEYERLIV